MGVFAVDFRRRARNWWGLRRSLLVSNRASFEGRRDGGEGQGAGVVQIGVDGGGNVGKWVVKTGRVSRFSLPRKRPTLATIRLSRRWGTRWSWYVRCGPPVQMDEH